MIDLDGVDQARLLLGRFDGFFDAVLIEVHLSLPRESAKRHALLRLLAAERKTDATSENTWQTVAFKVSGLDGYRLSELPETYLVLSDGLQIRWAEGRCVLDLSPLVGHTSQPDQFVSGSRIGYEIEEMGG